MNTSDLSRFDLQAPAHVYGASIVVLDGAAVHAAAVRAAKSRAAIPGEVPEDEVFTWSALISNQRLDSWYTKMATSSLQNYAADAATGVAFMNSHRHQELPMGYSIDGRYEEAGTPAEAYPRVFADFYTVKGMNVNGIPTDQFIKAVQYGMVRDVSIGFKEGDGFQYTCSVCGEDFYSWDCYHIPGQTYEVIENPEADPGAQRTKEVLCFAWVDNARLSEVSAVYDGATPDAAVVKATRELRGGRLKPDVQRMLESKYRIHLPETPKQFPGYSDQRQEGDTMNGEAPKNTSGAPDSTAQLAANERTVREFVRGLDIKDVDVSDATSITAALDAVRKEVARLRALEPAAEEGKKLRKTLIENTIKEGVRANGEKFDSDAKTRMLEALDADSITELSDTWRSLADSKLKPATKRTSADGADDGDGEENADGEGEDQGEEDRKSVV